MPDFSLIAPGYESRSVIQQAAGARLLELLSIRDEDDVLDLGCGVGQFTRRIRGLTKGLVVGVDQSEAMITEAKCDGEKAIMFQRVSAEKLTFQERFDVVFCNSAFQWFQSPEKALRNCFQSLRREGRIGMQAPAKADYSTNFVQAVAAVAEDPRTKQMFSHFRSPWFFLETATEYKSLFERAGFRVNYATIEETGSLHKPEEVFAIFSSGAAAGYLNPAYYDSPFTESYEQDFNDIVKGELRAQADQTGQVRLVFNRLYVLASRPE